MSISFKIALLQISRPWLDKAILKLKGLHSPGLHARAWSIWQLRVLPLITNTIILAWKTEISSKKFSKEVTDYTKETYWSKHCVVFVSTILSIMLLMYSTVWAYIANVNGSVSLTLALYGQIETVEVYYFVCTLNKWILIMHCNIKTACLTDIV